MISHSNDLGIKANATDAGTQAKESIRFFLAKKMNANKVQIEITVGRKRNTVSKSHEVITEINPER